LSAVIEKTALGKISNRCHDLSPGNLLTFSSSSLKSVAASTTTKKKKKREVFKGLNMTSENLMNEGQRLIGKALVRKELRDL
jgi:hypothetical protein